MGMRVWLAIGLWTSVLLFGLLLPPRVSAAPLPIINGADVPAGEQSWVVGILQAAVEDDYDAQFCGGTLIAAQWVLTAAHCTFNDQEQAFQPAALHVLVGRRMLRSTEGVRLAVDKIVRHPAFDATTYHNDIALLHLATTTTNALAPLATTATNSTLLQAQQAMVVGWGVTQDGVGADVLQRAQVPLVNLATCRGFYAAYGITIAAHTLCAGYEQGGVDACTGDSGGPLLVWNNQQRSWVQIGIISWGSGCAEAGVYGVYTEVADFSTWIATTLEQRGTAAHRFPRDSSR